MNDLRGPVSILLLFLTGGISLWALGSRAAMARGMLAPYEVLHRGRWYQVVTSGFLHADLGHLLMNMITLFFFGPQIEGVLGPSRFLALYFGSMIAGGLFAIARHGEDPRYRALGASGAVSGVIFSFVLFAPFAPIHLFLIPIGIPALVFAVGYVAFSIVGMRNRLGNLGHEAHLGGAVGGLLLTIAMYPEALRVFLSHFR